MPKALMERLLSLESWLKALTMCSAAESSTCNILSRDTISSLP